MPVLTGLVLSLRSEATCRLTARPADLWCLSKLPHCDCITCLVQSRLRNHVLHIFNWRLVTRFSGNSLIVNLSVSILCLVSSLTEHGESPWAVRAVVDVPSFLFLVLRSKGFPLREGRLLKELRNFPEHDV